MSWTWPKVILFVGVLALVVGLVVGLAALKQLPGETIGLAVTGFVTFVVGFLGGLVQDKPGSAPSTALPKDGAP